MVESVKKYARIRNSRTGKDRTMELNGTGVAHLLPDEYVIPWNIKDEWMVTKIANLVKGRELASIKAKLENMDEWALMVAKSIPDFQQADLGTGKYPMAMSFEEVNRFRTEHRGAISFYSIAIQYLERGHTPEEVKALMEERHSQQCGNDGVKVAFADHSLTHKELLAAV